jgi:hypothetical protein
LTDANVWLWHRWLEFEVLLCVQVLLAASDAFWQRGTRIAISDCALVCTEETGPYLELIKANGINMAVNVPGPVQKSDTTLMIGQLDALLKC